MAKKTTKTTKTTEHWTAGLDAHQVAAVRKYADQAQRIHRIKDWRAQLRRDWMRAGTMIARDVYPYLHQLRNSRDHGTAWLATVPADLPPLVNTNEIEDRRRWL